MEKRMIRSKPLDFSQEELDNIVEMVTDSWYYLSSYYQDMNFVMADKEKCDEYTLGCLSNTEMSADENLDKSAYDLKFELNNSQSAILKVKGISDKFKIKSMDEFSLKASELRRKNPKSILIPYGIIMFSGEEFWTNVIAQEMMYGIDLTKEELCEGLFSEDDKNAIMINSVMINQFELMAIKIPLIHGDQVAGSFIILSDETLIKKNENELNYKSAVVKEIHHRVKNNLQTIASLLRLQMRRVKSKTVIRAFKESINRISSIALIHEELSKDGIEQVNIKSTIASIMDMILTDMVPPNKDIKGELKGPDIYIDANKASSISLCITELIQNSIEHGFSFRKSGAIRIKLDLTDGLVTIFMEDDGLGFNPQKSKNSLGLEIIEMITKETLKGTFSIKGHIYGTQTQISFKL